MVSQIKKPFRTEEIDEESGALTIDLHGDSTRKVFSQVSAPVQVPSAGVAFLNHLVRIGLLSPNRADAFLRADATPAVDLDSAEEVGNVLIQAGLVTQYQVDRVMAGTTYGLVLGNYRVRDRLGAGGMGVVFLGEHVMMNRKVAIKVLPVDVDCPAIMLERFYAEMQVLASLQHPNIVMAYDSGELKSPSREFPTLLYLVMEFIEGSDLEQYVLDHGRIPIGKACNWISQAACGLQEAHNHRLIHRDVKPSNLLLTGNQEVKVMDFGVARQPSIRLTDPKELLGTMDYMAPEQSYDPTTVGSQVDIYGLGATLFWLLTGEPPYPRVKSINQGLKQLQNSSPRPVRKLRPDCPRELELIIDRLLERNPARRPAMPLIVKKLLEPFTTESVL